MCSMCLCDVHMLMQIILYSTCMYICAVVVSVCYVLYMQDRAFLGVTTLKELVLKRPHGPQGTEDFLQALLEVTMSSIELVR